MEAMFQPYRLGNLELANRFVFPPIKTGYGKLGGIVTDRQLIFYRQIARNGPAVIILEPVSVTPEGREHPKQLCVHLSESVAELKKIVNVIHAEKRLACLHLNHAGAAANPMVTGTAPKAPSAVTCPTSEKTSQPLTGEEIDTIITGYTSAARKAKEAGFDLLEIQAGHGYLVSQFLNRKINKRSDRFGEDRLAFAKEVFSAVKKGASDIPLIVRVSGSEMSPEFGIDREDLLPFIQMAEKMDVAAIHVGMGSSCFSPPWYFHHASLPEKPQMDALAWIRKQTNHPVIVAGRMGRINRIETILQENLADLVALGRPLITDPDLIEKWQNRQYDEVKYCGYCLQGCLHRLKNGEPLGCNLNPAIGKPDLEPTPNPLKILVAGGGPAGMSAAVYLSQRGHRVTVAEKEHHLGGQFALAWQAPGKQSMREGLYALNYCTRAAAESVIMGRKVDLDLVREVQPDLLVWATGAVQNFNDIDGLHDQYVMTSVEYFGGEKEVQGPRVLVIGAGRSGLEIAEKLGLQGFNVVATKRTDPIGSMMEMITRKLTLMRIQQMPTVTLMPHTTVKAFLADGVEVEQDGEKKNLAPFQTVILASGMQPAPGPDENIKMAGPKLEIIGDANEVQDIFRAVHAGYELAQRY
jgi:2,4-dienoyl-CoA reductase-like NADH-dependent reductase (Old Yellow Enzyme family)/NADPH-dependent 2,4-dienoyl-CoA reductase/sulfur reductase-like enzyme